MLVLQSIESQYCKLAINFKTLKFTMSNTCGNCDCSDKSQCVLCSCFAIIYRWIFDGYRKKGSSNTMAIETEKSYISTVVAEVPTENDCKCGANCSCTNCTCGCH
ncbi:Metallothionein-like protein type 3 [Gossypium australe]|uniref:Metallothionein-like protein type 3 n=1 Tax=Gossypium australe TaxID=47621 RepID=A0A5B6VEY5_9ROSI|nr:Metallothionein-like protein type 3 [Gossypium australe]